MVQRVHDTTGNIEQQPAAPAIVNDSSANKSQVRNARYIHIEGELIIGQSSCYKTKRSNFEKILLSMFSVFVLGFL